MVEYLSIYMSVLKYFNLSMYVCVCMYICIVLCILVGGRRGCGLGSIFRLTHTENLNTLPFLSFIMSFFEVRSPTYMYSIICIYECDVMYVIGDFFRSSCKIYFVIKHLFLCVCMQLYQVFSLMRVCVISTYLYSQTVLMTALRKLYGFFHATYMFCYCRSE